MALFDLKKNKFKKVKMTYWKTNSKVPLPWQKNDDMDLGPSENVLIDVKDDKGFNKTQAKERYKEFAEKFSKALAKTEKKFHRVKDED